MPSMSRLVAIGRLIKSAEIFTILIVTPCYEGSRSLTASNCEGSGEDRDGVTGP
jgi:hypothetical protein